MNIQEIYHPLYGKGFVKETRNKGFELQVEFEDHSIRWVRIDDITVVQSVKESFDHSIESNSLDDLKNWKYRKMIEAFRLGIVPFDCVQDFMIGRDKELRSISKWIKSRKQNVAFVVGEYGSGKTHLLQYLLHFAIEQNFAVSWIDVHKNETPLSKPKRIYEQLISSFRYPSKNKRQILGFRNFIKEALEKNLLSDHHYFKHLIGKTTDYFWEWIEGKSIYRPHWELSYPPLYNYTNTANIYCYLLSGMGWAAKQLGLSGYLLIFDEAESINSYDYRYEYYKSLNFLKALTYTANNKLDLLSQPYHGELDFCRKGGCGNIPFLYKLPSGMKLIFAFPSFELLPWELRWEVKHSNKYLFVELHPLDENALTQAIERIVSIYQYAYNYTFGQGKVQTDKIFRKIAAHKDRLRLFVKGAVEALDIRRFHPEGDILEILS
ncbi:MAG: DUF2791 family P-loop domain-containing protein [Candidatus Methanomethylicaceae archaeon]